MMAKKQKFSEEQLTIIIVEVNFIITPPIMFLLMKINYSSLSFIFSLQKCIIRKKILL